MLKIIKNENEFKIVDLNSNWSIDLDCDFQNRTGKNYKLEKGKTNLLKFKQENGITRYIVESKVVDGYVFDYKEESNKKSVSTKSSKVVKWNWMDYVNNDEKHIIEEYEKLEKVCIERHDKKVNDPVYKKEMELNRLKLLLEQQMKELEELKKSQENE